jgi:hypothetical protein
MGLLPEAEDGHEQLLREIKSMVDPHNILSPGRYQFYAQKQTNYMHNRFILNNNPIDKKLFGNMEGGVRNP